MNSKKAYKALFWVFIAIALAALGYFVYQTAMNKIEAAKSEALQSQVFQDDPNAEQQATQIAEMSSETEGMDEAVMVDESAEESSHHYDTEDVINPMDQKEEENPRYEYTENYHCALDFDALHEINPDIFGWIVINHMDISYPLVQHPTDDSFYLVHAYDRTRSGTGSIYTHANVSKTMTDYNSIIYGHNLYQGGWFTDLEMYYDEEFLKEHRDIVIYQEDKALHYTVYAAVIYSDILLDAYYDFNDAEDRQAFIDSLGQTMDLRSHVMDDMEVTPEDRLITLSTCSAGRANSRLLVVGVLTKVEALPEE